MTTLLFALALPWLLIGFGCWLGYQLVRQNGRILLRLEALEQRLEAQDNEPPGPTPATPSGLPLRSLAPEFELPDLAGASRRLSEFRGRRLLLIFFNPGCGFLHGYGAGAGGSGARRAGGPTFMAERSLLRH